MDNEVEQGGTNGIIAMSAKLLLHYVESWRSTPIFKESIRSRVGFITLLDNSELILSKCELQLLNGVQAGAIYSRGSNLITITSTDIENSFT